MVYLSKAPLSGQGQVKARNSGGNLNTWALFATLQDASAGGYIYNAEVGAETGTLKWEIAIPGGG